MKINCCICGNSISPWVSEVLLDKDLPSSAICTVCAENLKAISNATDETDENFINACKYFEEKQNSDLATPEIKSVMSQKVSEKLKEQTEKFAIQERLIQEEELLKSVMITSSNNFEGYKITKYIDVIAAEVALGTGIFSEFAAGMSDLFGTQSGMFGGKLQEAREGAMDKFLRLAVKKGANAVIAIDFDYHQFTANMIGIIVNGTAVVCEKIEK